MKQPKISVAVTTYKRPEMVEDLIKSYLYQSYKNSELVIIDDCVDDKETARIVESYRETDSRIRFVKNTTNLGYCKNFLKSLRECSGDYIVTLGDDDIFLNRDTLKKYVDIFEKYPKVGFIYSNIIQFNQNYEADYIYKYFEKSTLFDSLENALEKIWLRSCYIPGIGLRNNVDFSKLYPTRDWLFPQVELIGKILAQSHAYGVAEFLIGGRAHSDQLGFEAVKGNRIKKTEKHASIELPEIFETLRTYYAKQGIQINLGRGFVDEFFASSHASILPTEKINTGNIHLLGVFFQAVRKNKRILLDGKYIFYMLISLLLPKRTLLSLKNWYKRYLLRKLWPNEQKLFSNSVHEMELIN